MRTASNRLVEYSDQTCCACGHRYEYELEVRCLACDRGICPICARYERVERTAFCGECHASEASSRGV